MRKTQIINSIPKKALSVLLAVLMVLTTLTPLSALADEVTDVFNDADIRAAVEAGGEIRLMRNIQLEACLDIGENGSRSVTIDLNGRLLYRSLDDFDADGHVIKVFEGSTLGINNSVDNLGLICGGKAINGGGIYNEGTVNLYSGQISGNQASGDGAGVYNTGTLNVYGGYISSAIASGNGGAIMNKGTVNMTGGSVSSAQAANGGAIYNDGSLTASNVRFIKNSASQNGAGIYLKRPASFDGCTFNNNTATGDGGAIYVDTTGAETLIENSSFDSNYATNGGAVSVNKTDGVVSISNSSLKNNLARTNGGAVQALDATEINGSTISDNGAQNHGSGVFVKNNNLGISGSVVINDNTRENVYLSNNTKFEISGTLPEGARIGVTYESDYANITTGYDSVNNPEPKKYFFADVDKRDKGNCITLLNGEVRYDITDFTDYPPEKKYNYRVSIKTTDDADGWNHAILWAYVTDGYNGFGETTSETFSTFFENDIDDEGDEAVFNFSSDRFLSHIKFYFDIGGGATWHDWEGDVKLYINGVNTAAAHYVTSSSPFSSSSYYVNLDIPEDKKPYPEKVFFEDNIVCNNATVEQDGDSILKTCTGTVKTYAVDQYNTVWRNPDITITSNTYSSDIEYEDENGRSSGYERIDGDDYFYQSRTLCSKKGTDHTSGFTAEYKTTNILYPTVKGKFKAKFDFKHRLSIMCNDEVLDTIDRFAGETIAVTDVPTPTGYRIIGYDSTGYGTLEEITDEETEETTYSYTFGAGDGVLDAVTTPNTYQIAFDGNGSTSGSMSKKFASYGSYIQLPSCTFKKTGKSFAGWNTEPDGSGTMYANKEKVKNLTSVHGGTVTLYAQWEDKVYTVTLKYSPAELGREDEEVSVAHGKDVYVENAIEANGEEHYAFDHASKSLGNVTANKTITLYYTKESHTFGEKQFAPNASCYKDTYYTQECVDCGYVKTVTVPASHLNPVTYEAYPATCEAEGASEQTVCLFCGTVLDPPEIYPATGHDFDFENPEWKFRTDGGTLLGTVTVTCKNDDSHTEFASATITKDGNSFVATAIILGTEITKTLEIGTDIYAVNITTNSNGTMSASPEYAFEGDTVTLNSRPNNLHFLYSTTVTKDNVELELTDGTFTMPDGNVNVYAEFYDIAPNQCGNNAYFKYDKTTDTLTIFGEGEMFDYGTSSAYGETPFRRTQFNNCKHIVIDDGITKVGDNAFYGMKFSTAVSTADVIMANSVTEIGASAFREMSTRVEINLPANLEKIGNYAFKNAQASYNHNQINMIPASVTSIGEMAFYNVSMTDLYCYVDPSNLTWRKGSYDFVQTNTSSMKTKIHVYSDYLSGYNNTSTTRIRVNANFVGDLDSKVHNINLVQNEHCTISSNYDKMHLNGKVTLYAQPDEGYAVEKFIVTDSYNEERTVTKNKFAMPNSDVTVSVVVVPTYSIITDMSGGHGYFDVKSSAKEGETVTATYVAQDEYVPSSIIVTDEGSNTVEVNGDTFVMPASDVTISALYEEPELVEGTEPYIDDDGAYITGIADHYAASNGVNYAVKADGGVGSKLDSLELSYFDFGILSNGTYRVNYYTGPTSELTELVIPKTYKGRRITVVGSDYQDIFYKTEKTQFDLVLNENITEIAKYTFYTLHVKRVTGDLSGLRTVGQYAFSWANSPDGFAIELDLDDNSEVEFLSGAFNNMNVTFNMKHSTSVDLYGTAYKSVSYSFTDAHTYGEPEWTWSDDNSSATASFSCTDERCTETQSVNAGVTTVDEAGSTTLTATASFNDATYTDTKALDFYNISFAPCANGSVSYSRGGANEGNCVELAISPDEGYRLNTLTVKDADENDIAVTDGAFTMPASDVTVSATFVKVCTVQWSVGGDIVEIDRNVTEGETPEYNGETPADYDDSEKHYAFFGWSDGVNTYAVGTLPAVSDDVTYTAEYAETPHTYGEPVWAWAEDYSSAAATFTCTVGGEAQIIDASVVKEADGRTYTATAMFGGAEYTDTKVKDEASNSYSLTLDYGIKVNFYIDIPFYAAEGGMIKYSYLTSTDDKSAERREYEVSVDELFALSDGTRIMTLAAAPAQIAEDYIIEIYDANEDLKGTATASIEDYCREIVTNDAFAEWHDVAQSLLNYGALADEYFGYAALSKEVTGNDYEISHSADYKDDVDASEFRSKAKAHIEQGDVQISGVAYVALLNPELRFYVSNLTEAEAAEINVSIDDVGLNANMVKTENGICVRVTGLNASDFAKVFTVTVGTTEITYNGYAFLYTVLRDGSTEPTALKDLAKGIYRYAAACEAKFA